MNKINKITLDLSDEHDIDLITVSYEDGTTKELTLDDYDIYPGLQAMWDEFNSTINYL